MVEKTVLEMIAPSIEEAIEQGLEQLGLPREAVEIEVLDAGSRGIFGIGNRQARIRIMMNPEKSPGEEKEAGEQPDAAFIPEPQVEIEKKPPHPNQIAVEMEVALDVARNVVEELLEKMRVRASVLTSYIEQTDRHNQNAIYVDIQGDDLSVLIGRQAETLNALQYISSLIVAKELGQWITLVVDVQGYRERRERQLRKLANRLADQAINTSRRQVLEPMPGNERRYVHLELRDHPDVTTESIGEEPNRKVTISLK